MTNNKKKRQNIYLDLDIFAALKEDAERNHRTAPGQSAYIISRHYGRIKCRVGGLQKDLADALQLLLSNPSDDSADCIENDGWLLTPLQVARRKAQLALAEFEMEVESE